MHDGGNDADDEVDDLAVNVPDVLNVTDDEIDSLAELPFVNAIADVGALEDPEADNDIGLELPANIPVEVDPEDPVPVPHGLFGHGGVDAWNILPSAWSDNIQWSGHHKALRTITDGIPQTISDMKHVEDTVKRDGLIAAMEKLWEAYVRLGVVDIVP